MATRARDGTRLEMLVKMALPVFRQAERQCPRTGPGRKPQIPDWLIAVLIMIAVLKKKKSKSAGCIPHFVFGTGYCRKGKWILVKEGLSL